MASTFRKRMHRFEKLRIKRNGTAVSIKVRVSSGCFHREHSPHAFVLIDRYLRTAGDAEWEYLEHESGPELLLYLALGTAGVTLAKSVVDLITAIIKARSEGIKRGDGPSAPLELIVRRVDERDGYKEETLLRIGHADPVDEKKIEARLTESANAISPEEDRRGVGGRQGIS
jgi:hypothetical protein